ncbi:hypothetical protein LBMAG53_16590 [Planctomycetota bacterium]|nr:hypothetical protein LBMAG53_16590 [Planctomycetota bacterium]
MNRTGWIVLAVVVAALSTYLLWPEGGPPPMVTLFTGSQPTAFRLRSAGLEQVVADGQVTLAGAVRPVDAGKVGNLFTALRNVQAPAERVQTVQRVSLAAYGQDPAQRAVEAAGMLVTWGRAGADGFVADALTGRIFPTSQAVLENLEKAADRLDQRDLLPEAEQATRIELRYTPADGVGAIDRLALELDRGTWIASSARQRPPFGTRCQILLGLCATLKLDALVAAPGGTGEPLATLRLTLPGRAGPSGAPTAERIATVTVLRDGRAKVDDLPPQAQAPSAMEFWRETLADLNQDRLFDMPVSQQASLGTAEVRRAGKRLFRLEYRGLNEQQMQEKTPWALVWDGGREDAAPNAGENLMRSFDQVLIEQPERLTAPLAPGPEAIEIVLSGRNESGEMARLVIGDGFVASATWRGRPRQVPDILSHPRPDPFLDRRLTIRDPNRVIKLQRVIRDQGAAVGEVYVAADGSGVWRKTWPIAGPADAAAIRRLLQTISAAVASEARLATAEDRAARDAPALTIDLRFAAKPPPKGANDLTDPEETVATDIGFALAPSGPGQWRAVDRDGGLAWTLPEDVVEALRLPVTDRLVLPIPVALVRRLRVQSPDGVWELRRDGETWKAKNDATDQPGTETAVDPVTVRRWLRRVAGITASAHDVQAAPLAPGETHAALTIDLPGAQALPEQVTIRIGRPAAGVVPVSLTTSRQPSHLPIGRLSIAPDDAAALAPARSEFK